MNKQTGALKISRPEREFLAYWMERAILETRETTEAEAINDLRERISTGRLRTPEKLPVARTRLLRERSFA